MRIFICFLLLLMFSGFSSISSTAFAPQTAQFAATKLSSKEVKQQLKKEMKLCKQEYRKKQKSQKANGNGQGFLVGVLTIGIVSAIVFMFSSILGSSLSYWQALLWTTIGLGIILLITAVVIFFIFKASNFTLC